MYLDITPPQILSSYRCHTKIHTTPRPKSKFPALLSILLEFEIVFVQQKNIVHFEKKPHLEKKPTIEQPLMTVLHVVSLFTDFMLQSTAKYTPLII